MVVNLSQGKYHHIGVTSSLAPIKGVERPAVILAMWLGFGVESAFSERPVWLSTG
jgi:hypothetical protein